MDPKWVTALKRAWLNERAAPELLEYKDLEVRKVQAMIKERVSIMSTSFSHKMQEEELTGEYTTAAEQFMANLYQMETERVGYILRSYLRIRLKKIEEQFLHLTDESDPSRLDQLSPAEKNYVVGYRRLIEKNFQSSFLNYIPAKLRGLQEAESSSIPNLDQYVFLRVLQTLGAVRLDPDDEEAQELTMNQGDIYFVKYRWVQDLLRSQQVDLL